MEFMPSSPTFKRFRRKLTVLVRNFDDLTAMADMFEGIQSLPHPLPGVPNFRRVPSYKVFCCGQPTEEGFEAALNKVCGDSYPKDGKIVWINVRQEPCVYVNGQPICARPPDKIGKFAELGAVTMDAVVRDEKEFLKLCTSRAENNENKLKFMDVNSVEQEVEFKDAKTLANVMDSVKEKFPGLVTCRVPIAHGAAPKETDFDAILNTLIGSGFNTPVIVNDHIGDNRSTTGGIIACIFKEFQVSASYDGLVQSIPGVDMDVLKMDKYKVDKTKDPMVRGEFNVINDLMKSLEGSEYAKKECDKIVDVNGTPNTGGSGLVQIREEIAANKMNYELMEDAEQVVLKAKIMDNIQKYFYLIVFTVYMREAIDASKDEVSEKNMVDATLRTGKHAISADELVIKKNFVQFMQEKDGLRDLIEEGKGNLKWERDIPDLAWETLQDMATDDFDKNLGAIIKNIFSIAHSLFSDLMAGPDKKRATYRFASKTLLRLLPPKQKAEVDMLISKKRMALDLYDILGHCTFQRPK